MAEVKSFFKENNTLNKGYSKNNRAFDKENNRGSNKFNAKDSTQHHKIDTARHTNQEDASRYSKNSFLELVSHFKKCNLRFLLLILAITICNSIILIRKQLLTETYVTAFSFLLAGLVIYYLNKNKLENLTVVKNNKHRNFKQRYKPYSSKHPKAKYFKKQPQP